MEKTNIVLIGMPGAGKSTIGVLLAKTMGMPFIDTDLLIQQQERRLLQDIINNTGIQSFLALEERAIMGLNVESHIIATGGSVIYSDAAVGHLKSQGVLFYLKHEYEEIEERIQNITTRGIVLNPGQQLSDIYKERLPLYEKHSDITIDCSHKHIETVIAKIKQKFMAKKLS
jgi:shikimate kinase